ncbi:hypothetical protein H072_4239 [Dactylellina haptotyla CBS 200.50]|uniref:Protein transport protein Sec61 subunit beta n=1 Tax=Dactylellina haptotyla (strain CBS 200.50) TaxID=1284197 RepID=S8AG83_DACHA|nr:hypothetical protein H072_4239 [Dactylellina haptotyla CBS 200.50]
MTSKGGHARASRNKGDTATSSPSPEPQSPPTGSATGRASPAPPGGPKTVIKRRAAADRAASQANARPSSTRAAGAGGSSSTMLKLYTDESPGLKVDPVVVLVLSLGFIFSVVALHIIAKISRKLTG